MIGSGSRGYAAALHADMESREDKVDYAVPGGDNAGPSAAAAHARAGTPVILAEPEPRGGLCSWRGCHPKETLVRASIVLQEARHGGDDASRIDRIGERRHFTDPVPESADKAIHVLAMTRFGITRRHLKA